MRTAKEIAEYYASIKEDDFFGFLGDVFVRYLPRELVKSFLKGSAVIEDWEPEELSRDSVVADMEDYMIFAWDKVENHRGLSANRSVDKMSAWLYILENEDLIKNVGYSQYGAPIMAAICEEYAFPIPEEETVRNMIQGMPCRDDCNEGCGL